MSGRILVVAIVLVVIVVFGWRANLLGVRTEAPFGSVARAFDPAPAYPGYVWTRDGHPVSNYELETIAGCSDSATFLFIGWPPGTVASSGAGEREYIRDPAGVVRRTFSVPMEPNIKLPSDARPTGYRLGVIQLYLGPSHQDQWIYVVGPSDAERWPRSDPMTLCS